MQLRKPDPVRPIENQLRSNDPPETQETLDRLMRNGHTRKEAMKLILAALAVQMFFIFSRRLGGLGGSIILAFNLLFVMAVR